MLGEFSRRHFAKLAGFSAVGMAAGPAKSEEGKAEPAPEAHAAASFPSGFVWGTATSAYQIERPRPSSMTAPSRCDTRASAS